MKLKNFAIVLFVCIMMFSTSASALTITVVPSDRTTFSDVPSSHWAYRYVMTMADKGILKGTSTPVNGVGTYSPNGKVTVGEFLTIATRLVASNNIKTSGNFPHWAIPYYHAAVSVGLITSDQFDCTSYVLNTPISREDMASILVEVARVNGETLHITPDIEYNMLDYNTITDDKKDAVCAAYSNGLLTGKSGHLFAPKDNLTRAEVATVFCRVMNYIEREKVVLTYVGTERGKYVVTEPVETQNMLRPVYSVQFGKDALNGVRYGVDEKGIYVEVTAPILPNVINDEYFFDYSFDVYRANGDYFAEGIWFILKPGESAKAHFVSFEETSVSLKMLGNGYAKAGVMIMSNKTNRYPIFTANNLYPNRMVIQRSDNMSVEAVDYNSSHIWKGIGK
ncbi:MAG: S-layer homology domain-containing protein [Clostridia bacterium]|nr:S-layer homology domain-containing protein [Clostridia bacterium]